MSQIEQHFISYQGCTLYQNMRLQGSDILLIFIHGLGDSHLNYQIFFDLDELRPFDMLAPDLLGHGKSCNAENYDYQTVIKSLYAQLVLVVRNYHRVILLPHSVGGIIATRLCHTDLAKHISGVFALETSVTQYGSYLTEKLAATIEQGVAFGVWFSEFKNTIYQQGLDDEILRLYYSSLCSVDSNAFLNLGLETRAIAIELQGQEFTNSSGLAFAQLDIAKAYCLGEQGNQHASMPFLESNNIPIVKLPTDSHWLAQRCPREFSSALKKFIERL